MSGVITRKEVILNSATVIRAFGLRVYFRCLFAKRGELFLSILRECGRI